MSQNLKIKKMSQHLKIFKKCLKILKISQMSQNRENFKKCPIIWKISKNC